MIAGPKNSPDGMDGIELSLTPDFPTRKWTNPAKSSASRRCCSSSSPRRKAIAHFNKVGEEQAYKDLSDPTGSFIQGDMYVIVMDNSGNTVHHAVNPKLINKSVLGLRDADGKEFGKEIFEGLKKADSVWVDYKWSNLATKKIAQKHSFVKRVNKDRIFNIGYFN